MEDDDVVRRTLSRVELCEIADDLQAAIASDRERDIEVKDGRVANDAQLPTVFALRQHVFRLGAVVVDLYRRDLTHEAMVLIRLMYECAITATWAADSNEAIGAFANEALRQRRNLAEDMRVSTSQVFRDNADNVAHINDSPFESSVNAQGRQFRAHCEALEGGAYAYAVYRSLSAQCHASVHLVDPYVIGQGDARPCFVPLRRR